MSTNKTEHYQLHLWEPEDNFLRAEFNENNVKVDEVLGQKSRLAVGMYVGTGTFGASNPNTLSFEFEPKLVFVRAQLTSEKHAGDCKFCDFCFKQGEGISLGMVSTAATEWSSGSSLVPVCLTTYWDENSVSWYHTFGAGMQGNYAGITYLYWAVG